MISIVIPTLNRGKYIKSLLTAINQALDTLKEAYEVILVDDGSSDENRALFREIAVDYREHPFQYMSLKCILLQDNVGQQNATLAGIGQSIGDYIVTMDDDLQYDPKLIVTLLYEIKQGYDVVYGVPKTDANGHYRLMGTRIKEWVFYRFIGKPRHIRLTSFRVMTREIANNLIKDTGRHVYLSARLLQKTKNIGQVEITYHKEQNPNSRYKWHLLVQVIWHLIVYYGKIPVFKIFRKYGDQYQVKEILL
jgi:undecaprenyl-phosphate 4-deoxy-4-formamido-L-arabinose transferase